MQHIKISNKAEYCVLTAEDKQQSEINTIALNATKEVNESDGIRYSISHFTNSFNFATHSTTLCLIRLVPNH